ncbi:hypothetical protein DSM106972_090110 [Dulcicalothrix desertica PCC 7102]|uniref:Cell division protein FtsL n=1 Tax=Dulcicalothrix desertica PCC 7102 TaxID=232991 RepID=A0A3S1C2I7_9CYAN|nr:hypothetical protein [Dulcicalothrix desertica]RUS95535.1 hypothetical protein DSM106972_090110 [Dulcicalothrix desertica PCC 7102]TWH54073.1 hypothetical protein CAL7102_02077 [Dulcicalothrix desertica PCC 7102]
MAVRKKNVDSSATGGWFRRRRSQRRNSNSSVLHDSTNVQEGKQNNLPASQITGVSQKGNKQQTYKNGSISQTSTQGLNKKQRPRPTSSKPLGNLTQSRPLAEQEIPVMYNAAATMPSWLLRLCSLQRYTSVLSFLLVVSTLIAYGYTVYSQQLWSKSYRKLQDLQRNERQLTITNNALKTKIAAEAENKSAGLTSPSPASQIFLPAAPNSKPDTPSTVVNTPQTPNSIPIGY